MIKQNFVLIIKLASLILIICDNYSFCQNNIKTKDICVIENLQLPFSESKTLVSGLGFCQIDTTRMLNSSTNEEYYCFCDSSFFNLYHLSKIDTGNFTLLIEIKQNTGSGGFHYFIVERHDASWKVINFFQGYLDCILSSSNYNYDIKFSLWTDEERVTLRLSKNKINYAFKNVLDVSGKNVSSKNKNYFIKKYDDSSLWMDLSQGYEK